MVRVFSFSERIAAFVFDVEQVAAAHVVFHLSGISLISRLAAGIEVPKAV